MLRHRIHDRSNGGPVVLALHGGPGAPGSMAGVARGLEDRFRVIEPFERRSGGAPLTVARHVADLAELIEHVAPGEAPALVGSSWGAMLALACAAAHPERIGPLVLIGCGTFDLAARALFERRVQERMGPGLRRRIAELESEHDSPDEHLAALGRALLPVYAVEPITNAAGDPLELGPCDARGHRETWADMLRRQADGSYPQSFGALRSPVLMLHGDEDPHPGPAIRDNLQAHLKQLEYVGWPACGHYPWLERGVREEFFRVLRAWLEAPR